jgi:hypothetical protein
MSTCDPSCHTCGHAFSAHDTTGFCACTADVGGKPCPCHGFVHLVGGQLRSIADYTPPSREDRTVIALEALAAVEAMLARNFHRLNAILLGSEHPAHFHALEAITLAALLLGEFEDSAQVLAALRQRINEAGAA